MKFSPSTRLQHRRDMADRLGAARTGTSVDDIREWTGRVRLRHWSSRPPIPRLVSATPSLPRRSAAASCLVGIPDGDIYILPAAEARRRGLKIKFARRMGEVYPRAIELVAGGKVDVTSLVTAIDVGLDEAPGIFRNHADNAPGYIKSLIYPNGVNKTGRMT